MVVRQALELYGRVVRSLSDITSAGFFSRVQSSSLLLFNTKVFTVSRITVSRKKCPLTGEPLVAHSHSHWTYVTHPILTTTTTHNPSTAPHDTSHRPPPQSLQSPRTPPQHSSLSKPNFNIVIPVEVQLFQSLQYLAILEFSISY